MKTVKNTTVVRQAAPNPNLASEPNAAFYADGAPYAYIPKLAVTATAIGTAAKTTTSDEPPAHSLVFIQFTNGNNAASPTVAFNGGTARNILLAGAAPIAGEATVAANGIVGFYFDGTSLHQFGVQS